jgi:hypothetical protein
MFNYMGSSSTPVKQRKELKLALEGHCFLKQRKGEGYGEIQL